MKGMTGRSARETARRVLKRVGSQDAYASLALSAELDASNLDSRDRRLATELVYGVLRHRSRLDRALAAMSHRGLGKVSAKLLIILRVAAYQILFLDRVPAHAAVDDAVHAARHVGGGRVAGFVNGMLRRLSRDGEPALPDEADREAHVEVAYSLPRWLTRRLAAELPAGELVAAAAGLSAAAPLTIRVNTLRASPSEVQGKIEEEGGQVEPSPRCATALFVTGLGDPEASASFQRGLWTVQDLSAQLVAEMVVAEQPMAGQLILDACAGLGGKATHLAQLTGDGADICAADISATKLAKTMATAERLGLHSIRTLVVDFLGDDLDGEYDAILLDAPCSGLGVLRRHPEAKWRVREGDIGELAVLQGRLLARIAPRLRRGGALIYSVCTFTPEEGREQIRSFLAAHPDFVAVAEVNTWPHRDGGDAFYAARLERRNPD